MRHNLSKSLVPRVEILQDRMGHNPPESLFLRVEFPQSKKQGRRFRDGFTSDDVNHGTEPKPRQSAGFCVFRGIGGGPKNGDSFYPTFQSAFLKRLFKSL